MNVSLTSKTINLSGTVAPRLIFWHKYDFKSGDYGRVEVSGNDGSTWTELGNFTNGTLNAWTKQEYSLFAYRGNSTVKIRFRVTSNASGTGDGWYIDDVWVGDCVTYTYPDQGLFTAWLRVTDNDAKQAIATEKITVFANQNTSFAWVANYSGHQVVKLSDDGKELARISGFSSPREVRVNPKNGDVWIADTNNNRVVKLLESDQNGYDVSKTNNPDSSPSRNGGFFSGSVALGTGKFDNGLVLTGSGGYVQIPDSPVFRMTSWTMEAWINPSNLTGIRTIVGKVSQSKDFALVLNGNKPAVLVYQGARRYVTSPDALTAGTWYHMAGVYDAATGNVTLYVDGVVKKQETWTPDTSNTDPLLIGKSNCCSEYFIGN
ncbi:MAG: hypothetical protein FJY85_21290, partial [Deltaproteobacteria bacterium]|nr:hypothetical protein [Deltaproteobacteria bacterium]